MKDIVLNVMLYIARTGMRFIYFFIKLFTRQKNNKVTMLSRQSNSINLDFKLLNEELKKLDNVEIKIFCKKIPNGLGGKINYCFKMISDMYHIATSKVCISDGYNIPTSSLKHKKGLEIIQIWHAMGAIKKFGYQVLDKEEGSSSKVAKIMKMHANYSLVSCTSKATREFFVEAFNTDRDKIKVLGMPRIDYILGKNNSINEKIEKILQENPKLKLKKNILYVPTFRKNEKIDLSDLINKVDEEKYNLIIRLHPLDETEVDNKYIVNKCSTTDLLKIADYVITDYSAIAFETAILNKPLYFYVFDIDKYEGNRGLNIDLLKEMKSCSSKNIDKIIDIIENKEYDYDELRKFKERYVETADTNNTTRIVEYIIKILKNS